MAYKIAFSGTHGTGKTTAVFDMARKIKTGEHIIPVEYPNVGLICEVARESPFPINRETTLQSQTWMFCEQLTREMQMGNIYNVLVLDRTIYDYIAYTWRVCKSTALSMLDIARKNTYYDEIIIKSPKIEYLVDDNFRDQDTEFQMYIDQKIREIYKIIGEINDDTIQFA